MFLWGISSGNIFYLKGLGKSISIKQTVWLVWTTQGAFIWKLLLITCLQMYVTVGNCTNIANILYELTHYFREGMEETHVVMHTRHKDCIKCCNWLGNMCCITLRRQCQPINKVSIDIYTCCFQLTKPVYNCKVAFFSQNRILFVSSDTGSSGHFSWMFSTDAIRVFTFQRRWTERVSRSMVAVRAVGTFTCRDVALGRPSGGYCDSRDPRW